MTINVTDNTNPHTLTFAAGPAGQDTVTPDGGLESMTFNNPTQQLIVNGASGAADTFTFTSLDSGFKAALSVTGHSGADVTNLNTGLTLGSGANTGNVSISTNTINLGANIDTTGGTTPGTVSLTGNTTVTASAQIKYGGTSGLSIGAGARTR